MNFLTNLGSQAKLILFAVWSLLCVVLGIFIGHWMYAPTIVHETPAAAVVLPATASSPHGALIAQRAPDPAAKPAQAVPKGYKVKRVGHVTVQTSPGKAAAPCRPVTVDWSLVQSKDGQQRMIDSSPDGQVVSAVDIPIAPSIFVPDRSWAAGINYGTGKDYGAWVDRDFGRLRIGAEINQVKIAADSTIEARLKIGVTF